MTRKYDTLIHSSGYGERRCDTLAVERKDVSLQPSLIALSDILMR